MFANNEIVHKRLEKDTELKYMEQGQDLEERVETSVTMEEFLRCAFGTDDKFDYDAFLEQYEFIYDETREQIMLIIRDARIRIRKYFYLPPVYVAWSLKNGESLNWEPQYLRFYQKFKPYSYLIEEKFEDTYLLAENPYQVLYHPHIDASAHACYGHWHENLKESIGPYAVVESLRGFLCDYNGRSTFFNIDPYAFDRKPNANHNFPYQYGAMISIGYPQAYKMWNDFAVEVLGENWLVDWCEDRNKNYIVAEFCHNWFLFVDNQDMNPHNFTNEFDKWITENKIEGFTPCRFPGNDDRLYNEEEWQEKYKAYEVYNTQRNEYQPTGFSNDLHLWVMEKIGYDFSMGELQALQTGMNGWCIANLRQRDEYAELFGAFASNEPRGFRLRNVLQTMGQRVHDQSGARHDRMMLMLIMVKNSNLNQIMLKTLEWEYYARASMPADVYNKAYRESHKLVYHRYGELKEAGFGDQFSFDAGRLVDGPMQYAFSTNMPMHHFLGRVMEKLSVTFKNMRSIRQYSSPEQQRLLLDVLFYQTENQLEHYDWSDKFDIIKIKDEDVWYNMMKRFFIDYIVSETGNDREFFWQFVFDNCNEDHDLMKRCFDGNIYDMTADDREHYSQEAVRIWYTLFPNFPNSIKEMGDLRLQMDKEIITKSLHFFLEEYSRKNKEYKDVLKNTLQSMEQGELFSETVPI